MIPQLPIAVIRPGQPLGLVWFALEITDVKGRKRPVNPTLAAIETQVRAHFPDAESFEVLSDDPSAVASEWHTYRRAWTVAAGRIRVDLELAKQVHRDNIAARANREVQRLGPSLLTALASNDAPEIARLRARSRALEEAANHPAIAAAPTLEALRAIDPLASLL